MISVAWRKHGVIRFETPGEAGSEYTMSDPTSEELTEAMDRARNGVERLTQSDLYRLLFAVSSYQHLATHPAGTGRMIDKLRALRRACEWPDEDHYPRDHVATQDLDGEAKAR